MRAPWGPTLWGFRRRKELLVLHAHLFAGSGQEGTCEAPGGHTRDPGPERAEGPWGCQEPLRIMTKLGRAGIL